MNKIKKEIDKSCIILINSALNKTQIDEIFNIESIFLEKIEDYSDILHYIKLYNRNEKLEKLLDNSSTNVIKNFIVNSSYFNSVQNDYDYLRLVLKENNYKLIILEYPGNSINLVGRIISDMSMNIDKNTIRIAKNIHGKCRTIKYNL